MTLERIPAVVVLALFCACGAMAGTTIEPQTGQSVAAGPDTPVKHSLEHERSRIRTYHLKRLDEKMTIEPHALIERCRYESDIGSHPPEKQVALTFDDGPEPVQTEFILNILHKHKISATFFLIGQKAKEYPDLVKKIMADGPNLIGNHSWDHPNFHEISPQEQADEIARTAVVLPHAPDLKLFRYPYGNSSCETNSLLKDDGYRIVGWHIDSCDWAFDRNGDVDAKEAFACGVLPQNTKDFVEHVVSTVRAHNGGIILMHEIHPHTLAKLDEIITRLQKEGFIFTSLDSPSWRASFH